MPSIAVVDDSRLARTFAMAALKGQGHEVVDIDPTSLFGVLEALKEKRPDCMVVDWLMPLCPAQSLIRACREESSLANMRIVVLTAHRDDEVLGRLERFGVSHVLLKPVAPEALAALVKDALDRAVPE